MAFLVEQNIINTSQLFDKDSCDPINQYLLIATNISLSSTATDIFTVATDETRLSIFALLHMFITMEGEGYFGWVNKDDWLSDEICSYFGVDCVFIETVGIGQSEIDIRFLADRVFLVVQPMGGDEVQFLKAGIMEVPDEIVLNKCDAKQAAQRSYQALKASMALARPFDEDKIRIHRVSAKTGMNLDRLAKHMLAAVETYRQPTLGDKEHHYFAKWVKEEFGRRGFEP